VISRATVSTVPAYPKKLPTVLIASLAVMVLSSGWVLTRELLAAPVTAAPRAARASVQPRRRAAAVADAAGRFASLADHAPTAIGVPVTAIKQVAADVNGGGGPIAMFDAGRGLDTTGIAIKLARLGRKRRTGGPGGPQFGQQPRHQGDLERSIRRRACRARRRDGVVQRDHHQGQAVQRRHARHDPLTSA
jgi:hypothetical protein